MSQHISITYDWTAEKEFVTCCAIGVSNLSRKVYKYIVRLPGLNSENANGYAYYTQTQATQDLCKDAIEAMFKDELEDKELIEEMLSDPPCIEIQFSSDLLRSVNGPWPEVELLNSKLKSCTGMLSVSSVFTGKSFPIWL